MLSPSPHRFWVLTVMIGPLLASAASAQFVNQAAARWYVNGAVASGVYGPYYNPYWGWGAAGGTTAYESYGRGMADVIRARGEYRAQAARAARDYEAARSRYIDNQTKWLAEYNQRRRMGQAQRNKEQQEYRDYINRGRSARAASRAADLPDPEQVDPDTGEIDWPDALREPRYAQTKNQIDDLVRQWARGGDASQLAPQVSAAVDRLQKQLHANIGDYAANDFIAADRLLTGLSRLASTGPSTAG